MWELGIHFDQSFRWEIWWVRDVRSIQHQCTAQNRNSNLKTGLLDRRICHKWICAVLCVTYISVRFGMYRLRQDGYGISRPKMAGVINVVSLSPAQNRNSNLKTGLLDRRICHKWICAVLCVTYVVHPFRPIIPLGNLMSARCEIHTT
jgi:hypothetical protein